MAKKIAPRPRLLVADAQGNIYDHPELLLLVRRGEEFGLPRPDELMPLPEESEMFRLPGRKAVGLDPESGEAVVDEDEAVAAFISPGHTISSLAAYATQPGAPTLPMFAYGAVGYEHGKFWVCASKVDPDQRQVFSHIPRERIQKGAQALLRRFPKNRLVQHLAGCALTNCCPAARNLALGRFEAPLPTARTCNARCVGCISEQPEDSGFPCTQQRIAFTPTADEVAEVMLAHVAREPRPILSFGQGCEGEPLTEAGLIAAAVRLFREKHAGKATVNVNTNGSRPDVVAELAAAGVNSLRISLNSARPGLYEAYYRPRGYGFSDVTETIRRAKAAGLFISLNLLYFPGVTDSEGELEALSGLIGGLKVDFVQLRNLNLDPELYMRLAGGFAQGSGMGLANFRKRLRRACPWLKFGYFNPYLGEGWEPGKVEKDADETPEDDTEL